MARNEDIAELNTETFTDVKSIIGSLIDYATDKDIESNSYWNKRKNWTEKILDWKCGKWCSPACSLFCLAC